MRQSIKVGELPHSTCKLRAALRLIGGGDVRASSVAYPSSAPPRFARLLQIASSACNLLFFVGRGKTLVSGRQLAFLGGEIEYLTPATHSRCLKLLAHGQPLFILPGGSPAANIALQTGCDPEPPPRLLLSSHCVVVVIATWNARPVILHYGMCAKARAEIRRGARGLQIAALDRRVDHLIPSPISCNLGDDDVGLSVQSRLHGIPSEFSWQRVDEIAEFWLADAPATAVSARPRLSQELTEVYDGFPAYRNSLCVAGDALLEWHLTTRMPGDISHGDLWLGNVLFSGDTLTGIVDWEWARTDGLRLADVLHLIFMSYSASRGTSIAYHLRQFWIGNTEDWELKTRLANLAARFGMDMNDLKFMTLLVWFDHLRQNAIRGTPSASSWTEDLIRRTTPVIRTWLNKHN